MSVQCGNVPMLEAKIYSQTDIFSELRLQRSEQGSNLASFPGAEDGNEARHAGAGIVFDTRSYCSTWG